MPIFGSGPGQKASASHLALPSAMRAPTRMDADLGLCQGGAGLSVDLMPLKEDTAT